MGFRRVTVDFKQPGGLDLLIEQIKARHDWIRQEEAQYLNGPWPIGMLAHRIGMDTIEVGVGLATRGVRLKVAAGNLKERDVADKAVRGNARRGCVLDLLAFWTAWRLRALEAVRATCGPIHLPQSVLDRLRARREQFDDSAHDGLRSASYDNGKISLQEISAEMIVSFRDDLDRAVSWTETNTTIAPIVADDNLPAALREHLRSGRSDMFDSLVLARKAGFLLVTDDLPTREIDRVVGGGASAWLHVVFGVALDRKHIDTEQYVRWSANLIEAGHNYLGVTGPMLAHAARLDATVGEFPGYLFRTITTMIGGRIADPLSHIDAVLGCLKNLWEDSETTRFRQPVTGFLLRQLVRERENDYGVILRTVLAMAPARTGLTNYIHGWLRGHFLADAVLNPRR